MRWWMRSSRSTSALALVLAALLGALLGVSPVAAQGSLEERYQRAVDAFNNAKLEDACELFQQIEKEKPGYKQTHTYLNPACAGAKQAYDLEERLFNEGNQFLKQGKLDEAQQRFEQAAKLELKNPKHRAEIQQLLKEIDARRGEETQFQQAVKLFNDGNDTDAKARFSQIVQQGGSHAAEARDYLKKIADRREASAFNEGVRAFNGKDYATARSRFQEVVGLNGSKRSDAEGYLNRISNAEREERAFSDAVKAFDQQKYADAKAGFQQVSGMNGNRKAEAESYLNRIAQAQREESAFRDAVGKFNQKDFDGARSGFQQVVKMNGRYVSEARGYLARIDAGGQDPRQVAQKLLADAQAAADRKDYADALSKLKAAQALTPSDHAIQQQLAKIQGLAADAQLRSGLEGYFKGEYTDAEQTLSEYLKNQGPKRALAYFFRGAAHSARYFLSGEQDSQQKQQAVADFQALHKVDARFRPPEKYVAPKILALYAEVVGAKAP